MVSSASTLPLHPDYVTTYLWWWSATQYKWFIRLVSKEADTCCTWLQQVNTHVTRTLQKIDALMGDTHAEWMLMCTNRRQWLVVWAQKAQQGWQIQIGPGLHFSHSSAWPCCGTDTLVHRAHTHTHSQVMNEFLKKKKKQNTSNISAKDHYHVLKIQY